MYENNSVKQVNSLFLWTIFTYFVANMALQLAVGIFQLQLGGFEVILFSQVILILPTVVYVIRNKINIIEFVRLKKISISTVLLLILFTWMITPVMSFINILSMLLFENTIGSTINSMVAETNFLLCFLAVGILPSIFEEFVYRGVFYNEYRKQNVRKGILVSALLFGLLHMNMNQLLYALAMGMVFCLVIEATDSIVSTMIIHLVINGTSLVTVKVSSMLVQAMANQPELAQEYNMLMESASATLAKSEILAMLPTLALNALIFGSIAVVLFYVIAKRAGRFQHIVEIFKGNPSETERNKPLFSRDLWIAVGICVFFIIYYEVM